MARTNPQVTHATQTNSRLCWAACVKMVLEVKRGFVNPDITPNSVADRFLYGKDVNHSLPDYVIASALGCYGVGATRVKASLSFAEVKTEIDNNHPVIIGVNWRGGGGHAMVIGGYEESGANNTMKWVYLHDPLRDDERKVFFDSFVAGAYDSRQDTGVEKWNCTWSATIKSIW